MGAWRDCKVCALVATFQLEGCTKRSSEGVLLDENIEASTSSLSVGRTLLDHSYEPNTPSYRLQSVG